MPRNLLPHNTNHTARKHNPHPRIRNLAKRRPHAVLLAPVLLQLRVLGRVGRAVALLLARLVLLVAREEADVRVVGQWAEEDDRVEGQEWVGGVEEGEGQL